MKALLSKPVLITLMLLIVSFLVGAAMLGKHNTRASSKEFTLSTIEDFKAYEAIDRDQQTLKAELDKLNLVNNIDQGKKAEIRKRLGVPDNFVEKREDDKNPQSPVVGFVEGPAKQ